MRDPKLQDFIEATFDLLEAIEMPADERDLARKAQEALTGTVAGKDSDTAAQNPVRETWLESALEIARSNGRRLDAFCDAFETLEPELAWRRRGSDAAESNATEGYANALMVGPNGYENRGDVWLGVTLMSPGTQYPLHRHPPKELYLALTEGEWQRDDGVWFSPGVLGTVYNPPNVLHSMRAAGTPFLALWVLTG